MVQGGDDFFHLCFRRPQGHQDAAEAVFRRVLQGGQAGGGVDDDAAGGDGLPGVAKDGIQRVPGSVVEGGGSAEVAVGAHSVMPHLAER